MQPREAVPLAASWPCAAGARGGKLFRLDPRDYNQGARTEKPRMHSATVRVICLLCANATETHVFALLILIQALMAPFASKATLFDATKWSHFR
jgi:hypothetical protein